MTEHVWLKVVGIAGTIIPIGGALIGLGIYVGNLTNQIEASRSEVQVLKGQVSQLQDILQKTQSSSSAGMRGAQGPKGEPGDLGPRGPAGPQGEPGPAASAAEINRLIEAAIARQPSTSSAASKAGLPIADDLDYSRCVLVSDIQGMDLLKIKSGMEICAEDGRPLVKIDSVSDWENRSIYMTIPGKGKVSCGLNEVCRLPWTKDQYLYERVSKVDNKSVATLRKN